MELSDAIKARVSTRVFRRGALPRETVDKILEAARWAPSSCNLQLTEYVVVDSPELLARLAAEASEKFRWADTIVAVIYDGRLSKTREAAAVSAGAATENMLLCAADLGVAACPMAGFSGDAAIRRLLGIPGYYRLALLVALGHPASESPRQSREKSRLPAERISHRNGWSPSAALCLSERLGDWTAEDLRRYRERLAPVYLYDGHYRLQTFAPEVFEDALSLVLPTLGRDAAALDLLSYDGCAARKIRAARPDVTLTCADELPYVRDVLARDLGVKAVAAGEAVPEVDLATCLHKLEFDAAPRATVSAAAGALRPGGTLLLTASRLRPAAKLSRALGRLKDWLRGKTRNVYEGSPYYKIGPRRAISRRELASLATGAGLKIKSSGEREVSVPGAAAPQRYSFVIAEK